MAQETLHTHSTIEESEKENESDLYFIQAAKANIQLELFSLLQVNSNIDISLIKDEKKFTLLHYAAFHNQIDSIMVVIRHYQAYLKQEKNTRITDFVNSQTDDGFTAIHFASYRGNIKIIEYLETLGGNIYQTNTHGMNIMHIGAQGNQPISIIFAAERGIKITTLDNKAGTPLHWAAFYGCEQSVIYLLSLIPDKPPYYPMNHLDLQSFTPLHLAVLSGNSRVVKKLLIAGANKKIIGKNNQTPAQLAQENEFYNIESMIEGKQRWLVSYYNLKSKVQKVRKSKCNLLRFGFLIIFQIGTFILFCYRKYNLGAIVISLINLILFLRLSLSDPGYQKARPEKLIKLLQKFQAQDICPICNTFRFKRTKHCDICQRCVLVYDHHCPWINNCVGSKNHFIFLLFIILLIVIVILLSYEYIFQIITAEPSYFMPDTEEIGFYVRFILIPLCLFINVLFFIPLCLLLYTQLQNFFYGLTTLERFAQRNLSLITSMQMNSALNEQLLESNCPKKKTPNRYQQITCSNFMQMAFKNYGYYKAQEQNLKID